MREIVFRSRIYISGWYRQSAESLRENIESFLKKGVANGEFREELAIDGLRVYTYLGEAPSDYTVAFESQNMAGTDFKYLAVSSDPELIFASKKFASSPGNIVRIFSN